MRTQEGMSRKYRTGHPPTPSGRVPASGRRGAALVEFAIVLPLLMVLLLGIMEEEKDKVKALIPKGAKGAVSPIHPATQRFRLFLRERGAQLPAS